MQRTTLLWSISVLALAAVAAALFTQHVWEMQPCPWCVLQRLIFVAIALAALLGLVWRGLAGLRIGLGLVLALSLCGVAAALWQHFVAAASPSCNQTLADRIVAATGLDGWLPEIFQARASCAEAAVKLAGVSYEFWSLALFMLLAVLALRGLIRTRA
jgi:protein dithiol:quinone oxidoreductase